MDLERLARMGVITLGPDDEKLDQPSGIRNSALVARRLREIVAEVEGEAAHIKTGGRFTRVGLAAELGLLASNALNELQRLRPALDQGLRDRDRLRQELTVVAEKGDPDVAAALRQELRAEIRRRHGEDALLVKALALQCVDEGHAAGVAAVLELSGPFALLPERDLAEVRTAWARKREPAKAQLLARVEDATAEAIRTMAWAEARIRELGQRAADDPLARMAVTGEAA